MNTCGMCKFFGRAITRMDEETFEEVPTKFHVCEKINMSDDYKPQTDPARSDALALVQDGSGYRAALLTTESFGCIYWEERVTQ